jgi:hypothetical protein
MVDSSAATGWILRDGGGWQARRYAKRPHGGFERWGGCQRSFTRAA